LRASLESIGFAKSFAVVFALGFIVRLIPEILSFPNPIGFDTIGYAAQIKNGVMWHNWTWIFSTWLFEAIMIPIYQVSHVNPLFLLKLTAPVLYALNASGIYYFARKGLNWETKKAFLTACFFTFQLAALRLSWDLFENILGLGILLFALSWLPQAKRKKGFLFFTLLSVLVVLAHEIASAILFAVVFGVIIREFFSNNRNSSFRVFVAVLPAIAILLAGVYFGMFPSPFPLGENVILVNDTVHSNPGGVFFLTNYLNISDAVQSYPTYLYLFSDVFSLFSILFLLGLPLVLVGFFRDKILDSWALLVLAGSFGCILTPFLALDAWTRWMFIMVYPFSFYAGNGVSKVLESRGESVSPNSKWLSWIKLSKRTTFVILLFSFLIGTLFVTVRWGDGGIVYTPSTILYLPSTMLHNTLPLQDVSSAIEIVNWLNAHMNESSTVLVHHAFVLWLTLYSDAKNNIIYYTKDVQAATDTALRHGYSIIYMVWWSDDIHWYNISVPKDFVPVFNSGRIAVFEKNA
jgi:hypothetical protein